MHKSATEPENGNLFYSGASLDNPVSGLLSPQRNPCQEGPNFVSSTISRKIVGSWNPWNLR